MAEHPALTAAEKLAPPPDRKDAPIEDWQRFHLATGLAAYATFRAGLRGRPSTELGYLVALAVASTSAAVALDTPRELVAARMWSLTPEAGALNGEYLDYLAERLDELGINPADIDHNYEAGDFDSPSRAGEVG